MAEALFRWQCAQRGCGGRHWARAAGGSAGEPYPRISPGAVQALQRRGIESGNRIAVQLQPEDVRTSDLVLCMTRRQRDYLRAELPQYAGKIFMIGEYALGREVDVEDPFAGLPADYERAAAMLEQMIEALLTRLEEQA